MKFMEATLEGTIEQAELLFLNMLSKEMGRPYSQKIVEVILPLQYEFDDISGEWDRLTTLKGLKKQKIIQSIQTFKDIEYLQDLGAVKRKAVKIKLIPMVITKAKESKLEIVRGQNDRDTIEWGGLKLNKISGRFVYYKTTGVLSQKQKQFVLELLLNHKASYKQLYRRLYPTANRPKVYQRQIGYILKSVKAKLKIGNVNPDPFKNIRGWGYELV